MRSLSRDVVDAGDGVDAVDAVDVDAVEKNSYVRTDYEPRVTKPTRLLPVRSPSSYL